MGSLTIFEQSPAKLASLFVHPLTATGRIEVMFLSMQSDKPQALWVKIEMVERRSATVENI